MTNNEIAKKILQITRTGYYEDQLEKIVKLLDASKTVSGELPPDKDDLTLQDWKKLALQLSEVVSELRNEVKIIKQNRRNEIENAWNAGWDCRGDAIVSNNTDYSASDYFIKRFQH